MLKQEVLLDRENPTNSQFCILDASTHTSKVEENVTSMSECVESTKLLVTNGEKCEELKSLSGQVATPEQKKDLLFWDVGQDRFENKVKYFVLHDPSTNVPQRQAYIFQFQAHKKEV